MKLSVAMGLVSFGILSSFDLKQNFALGQSPPSAPVSPVQKVQQSQMKQQKKLDQNQQQVEKLQSGRVQAGEDHSDQRPDSMDDDNDHDSERFRLPFGLPSWQTPSLEPNVEPIFGNQFSSRIKGEERINSGDLEVGVKGALSGIPLIPVGIGVFADIAGGITRGGHGDMTSKKDINPNNSFQPTTATRGNQRYWAGGGLDVLFDSLRLQFGLEHATLVQDGLKSSGLEPEFLYSREIKAALAARIVGEVSGWYSFRQYRAYQEDVNRPLVKENDHYFHCKFELDLWDFKFDLGIGSSQSHVYTVDDGLRTGIGKGISRSFRNKMTWSFTENWRSEFYLKYAFSADDGLAEAYRSIRLPTQPLSHPDIIEATPQDFANLWFFSGAEDVIEGLTLGFAYGVNIANFTDKSKGQKTDRFGGPIVEYVYDF